MPGDDEVGLLRVEAGARRRVERVRLARAARPALAEVDLPQELRSRLRLVGGVDLDGRVVSERDARRGERDDERG